MISRQNIFARDTAKRGHILYDFPDSTQEPAQRINGTVRIYDSDDLQIARIKFHDTGATLYREHFLPKELGINGKPFLLQADMLDTLKTQLFDTLSVRTISKTLEMERILKPILLRLEQGDTTSRTYANAGTKSFKTRKERLAIVRPKQRNEVCGFVHIRRDNKYSRQGEPFCGTLDICPHRLLSDRIDEEPVAHIVIRPDQVTLQVNIPGYIHGNQPVNIPLQANERLMDDEHLPMLLQQLAGDMLVNPPSRLDELTTAFFNSIGDYHRTCIDLDQMSRMP